MYYWLLVLLIIFIFYFGWTTYGSVLINKEILIKRINPKDFYVAGDLTFKENILKVRFKRKVREFPLNQISKIKAYSLTDWRLSEYEQIDILLDEKYKIKLDGSLDEHQDFTELLLLQLGVDNKILDWGFLPQLNDKTSRVIIYEKNNIR